LFVNSWGVVCTLRKGKLPERNPLRTRFQSSRARFSAGNSAILLPTILYNIVFRRNVDWRDLFTRLSRTPSGTLFELKTSLFVLARLPEFDTVFLPILDRITILVNERHFYH
jgi:hypothetical protein